MQLYSALGIFVSTLDETEASEDFLQLEQHVREEWLTRALANAVSLAYHVAPDEERPPHNDDDEDDEDDEDEDDDDDDGDEAADASDEAPDATDEDTPSLLRGLSLQAQTNVCKRLLAFIASNEHLVRLWTTQPELQLIASQAGIPTNAADLRTLSRLLQCSPVRVVARPRGILLLFVVLLLIQYSVVVCVLYRILPISLWCVRNTSGTSWGMHTARQAAFHLFYAASCWVILTATTSTCTRWLAGCLNDWLGDLRVLQTNGSSN